MRAPKKNACGSCPYRRDVPAGIWHAEEYEKLPRYDGDTFDQPMGMFACHQQDDTLCSGWVGTHDMEQSLAMRLGYRHLTEEDYQAVLDYESPVPLFESGLEAAAHGLSGIDNPDDRTRRMITKLTQRRAGKP